MENFHMMEREEASSSEEAEYEEEDDQETENNFELSQRFHTLEYLLTNIDEQQYVDRALLTYAKHISFKCKEDALTHSSADIIGTLYSIKLNIALSSSQ